MGRLPPDLTIGPWSRAGIQLALTATVMSWPDSYGRGRHGKSWDQQGLLSAGHEVGSSPFLLRQAGALGGSRGGCKSAGDMWVSLGSDSPECEHGKGAVLHPASLGPPCHSGRILPLELWSDPQLWAWQVISGDLSSRLIGLLRGMVSDLMDVPGQVPHLWPHGSADL